LLFKGRANWENLRKNERTVVRPPGKWDKAPTDLGKNSQSVRNRFASRALGFQHSRKGTSMLGKIAAAIIGERLAGRNKGASGAVKGILVESVAKRLIPTIAAAAVLGYAYKKMKGSSNRGPSYPPDAEPSSPSG
jgi:hypothetical protein